MTSKARGTMSTILESPGTLQKSFVAELSAEQIRRMTRAELVNVIRAVHPAFLSRGMLRRIENRDREELERLAHLCRRCCRQQGY